MAECIYVCVFDLFLFSFSGWICEHKFHGQRSIATITQNLKQKKTQKIRNVTCVLTFYPLKSHTHIVCHPLIFLIQRNAALILSRLIIILPCCFITLNVYVDIWISGYLDMWCEYVRSAVCVSIVCWWFCVGFFSGISFFATKRNEIFMNECAKKKYDEILRHGNIWMKQFFYGSILTAKSCHMYTLYTIHMYII